MLDAIPAGRVFKIGYKPDAILLAIAEFVHHPKRRVSTVDLQAGAYRLEHLFDVDLHVGIRTQSIDRVRDSGVDGAGWCLRN